MIIELTGEDILIEDENQLDDTFNIHLCDYGLEIDEVIIIKIESKEGEEILLADYDQKWALRASKEEVKRLKEQAKIEKEAMKAGVDL